MAFIETVDPTEATGMVKSLYDAAEGALGYIPNYLALFSQRPEVYQAWLALGATIRKNMTVRRYELITLAAARQLENTYCMLAHANTLLTKKEFDAEQLRVIAENYHEADLTPEEIAIMAFAEKVIHSSGSITQADVDHLRSFGIGDGEILDITLAATSRSFFSKTLDALNAEPDPYYLTLDAALRDVLTVGRDFGDVP